MTDQQIIQTVKQLDQITKSYLYLTMCNRYITSNNDFNIYIEKQPLIRKNTPTPIPTYEQFFSDQNILLHNAGENWKENGFASQTWTTFTGAYQEYSLQYLSCAGSHYDPKGLEANRKPTR